MATEPVEHELEGGSATRSADGVAELEAESVPAIDRPNGLRRLWSWLWPKLAALALFIAAWQVVVWSGWRPDYVLPGPVPVFQRLAEDLSRSDFYVGVAVTLRRALVGYAIAIVIGSVVGLLVARVPIVRKAVGHAILGLQSMPSIAWLPLAILLFQQTEGAVLLVVILGASPAVATGLLAGVDQVPPLLVRVGHVMGARGLRLYRYVILPAALPGYVGGLKQGWAFAWRSLMAAEIINIIANQPSIGQQLQFAHDFADAEQLLALMIVIFFIGVVVDLAFGFADRAIRRRRGLLD
ncbi:MAG TPA: ABC transporter permease [Candidatus Dormibacteraeota bacterium]|nr:ABC transporter permease [Candidatus Dormibacteraeota bacterium]